MTGGAGMDGLGGIGAGLGRVPGFSSVDENLPMSAAAFFRRSSTETATSASVAAGFCLQLIDQGLGLLIVQAARGSLFLDSNFFEHGDKVFAFDPHFFCQFMHPNHGHKIQYPQQF
jgi:hypothetical protein